MNDINAAQRMKHAASDKAEAGKIQLVKAAEADAEAKYLSGVGIARQRMAIIDGLRESVVSFSKGIEGSSAKDVMDLVLITQYFDTLKDIGGRAGSNTVFVPSMQPGQPQNVGDQVRDGVMHAGGSGASAHMASIHHQHQLQLQSHSERKNQ